VRHDLAELHDLIDFWAALDLKFLYPGELVIDACSRLVARYRQGSQKDYRLSDTDLVHLGYALAYDMDYFLTTDRALKIPYGSHNPRSHFLSSSILFFSGV
jgi:hypothetical protein